MTPVPNRGYVFKSLSILFASLLIAAPALPRAVHAGEIPTFAVDAAWPKTLPNKLDHRPGRRHHR
jgi:hypothetical protein